MAKLGAADIAAILRREILKGTYFKGEKLPPSRELAETYDVSRNTLREALNRLGEEGLISTQRGSGSYVQFTAEKPTASPIQEANPLELIDARFALEPHICRLCVLHGRREDFDRLEELCEQMEHFAGDPPAFSEADTKFHERLALTTKNGLIIWLIGQINSVRSQDEWTRMRHLTLNEQMIADYNNQHRQILNAIRSREPERAANQMKTHLESARVSLMRVAEA